jgi:diaminopimelate decarboxylase
VRTAADAAQRPSLIFDTARIVTNAARFRADGVTTLFAVKSFPQIAALVPCDGFDVSSLEEARLSAPIISIADPTGAAHDARCERLLVVCETPEQIAAAPPRAEIALRVSMSITGRDPAIGAIESGGHRRSRFGVDTRAQIAALHRAAGGRPVGLHVHHGPVAATSSERFLATARAALALCDFEPRFLYVGGAWHAIADVPRALAEIRAAIPRSIELIVEPGRALVDGAGFACGRIMVARDTADRPLRVANLSRICHLRWSPVELVVDHPGRGASTLFVGPTCFEEDVLGDWVCEPPAAGDPIILRGVTGYAVGWNTSFGGVPPADVVLL